MTVGADARAVGAIAIGAEEAADGDGAGGRSDDVPRGEALAGALPRTAERTAVENRDFRRVRRDEVMLQPGVVELDDANETPAIFALAIDAPGPLVASCPSAADATDNVTTTASTFARLPMLRCIAVVMSTSSDG